MKAIAVVVVLLAGVFAAAQSKPDEEAIRRILDDEITTWKQGDTDGYSKHFATDGTFTNVMGMFFTGRQAFRDRHEFISRDRSVARCCRPKSCRCVSSQLTSPSARPWNGFPGLRTARLQVFASTRKADSAHDSCK